MPVSEAGQPRIGSLKHRAGQDRFTVAENELPANSSLDAPNPFLRCNSASGFSVEWATAHPSVHYAFLMDATPFLTAQLPDCEHTKMVCFHGKRGY
jgi:hypothetical protein